jgi:hypothetical protein
MHAEGAAFVHAEGAALAGVAVALALDDRRLRTVRAAIGSARYRRLAATGLACRIFRQFITEPDGIS